MGNQRILWLCLAFLGSCGGGAGEGPSSDLAGNIRSLTEPLKPNVFQSPNPTSGGGFGFSASFAGNYLAYGAPGEGDGAGRVYLFDGGTGNLAAELDHPEPQLGGGFGASLAGNAVVAIIGAPGAETAYVYNINDENLMLIFRSLRPTGKGQFGLAVAASDANFIIGAPGETTLQGDPEDPTPVDSAGRAYYFDCVTDVVLQEFDSPNAQVGGRFGAAVATIDFDVFIGAPDEVGGEGRVYHFDGLTGELLGTFVSPSGEDFGNFGGSLSVFRANGSLLLLVGAPNEIDPDNGDGGPDGRAHLFEVATGDLVVSLDTPNPFQGGLFGARVASNGAVLAVAAPNESTGREVSDDGVVYLFDLTGSLLDIFISPNGDDGGNFGLGLAVAAEDLLVGAPGESSADEQDGRAYLNPPAVQPQ